MLMCETLPGQLLLRGRAWLARCGNEALRRPSAAACYPSGRTLQNGCMVIGVNIVCKRVWLRRPLWVVIGRRGGGAAQCIQRRLARKHRTLSRNVTHANLGHTHAGKKGRSSPGMGNFPGGHIEARTAG